MSAPCAADAKLHLKVYVRRGKDSQCRRLELPDRSWAAVRAELERLAQAPEFSLTYTDDDGDEITVSTELDWDECARISPDPIRLVLRPKCKGKGRGAVPALGAPCASGCGRAVTGVAPQHCCHRCVLNPGAHGGRCAGIPAEGAEGTTSSDGEGSDGAPSAAALREFVAAVVPRAAEIVSRTVSMLQPRGCGALHHQAMEALERGDPAEAAALLRTLVQRRPRDFRAQYNLACALALFGDDGAMEALRSAVAKGYCDAEHMLTDGDLTALHAHPDWEDVVSAAAAAAAARASPAGPPQFPPAPATAASSPCRFTDPAEPQPPAEDAPPAAAPAQQQQPAEEDPVPEPVPEPLPEDPVQADGVAPEAGPQKCATDGCPYAVTGIVPRHCCYKCSVGDPHGPRCLRRALDQEGAEQGGAPAQPAQQAPAQPPLQPCAAGCGFLITGIIPTHCCRGCKNVGAHGPRCLRIPAPQSTQQQQQDDAGAASDSQEDGEEAVCASEGCSFIVTGIAPKHCCCRCRGKGGEHGKRCRRIEAQRTEQQQLDMGEWVEVPRVAPEPEQQQPPAAQEPAGAELQPAVVDEPQPQQPQEQPQQALELPEVGPQRTLMELGFSAQAAADALRLCDNNVMRACEMLLNPME